MPTIDDLSALEILDSRGRPTVCGTCRLASGALASASVPSGASTGAAEALELRDGDPARYGGWGCRKAVGHINGEIRAHLRGRPLADQAALDGTLVALDATPNKARLGANAILAVSLAFARAHALERGLPLYRHFAELLGQPITRLPRMTINLFSGGKHAGGQVAIQDVLIVPASPTTIADGLVMASAVYRAAVRLIQDKYQMRWLTADEGGLAPPAANPEQLFADAVESIGAAGLRPGVDVCLARRRGIQSLLARRSLSLRRPAVDEPADDRSPGQLDRTLSDREHRRRPGRGRLGVLARTARTRRRADSCAGRRPAMYEPPTDRPGGGPASVQRPAAEGEPDRHAERSPSGLSVGAGGGLAGRDFRPQRRYGRQLVLRSGGGLVGRSNQGRLVDAVGTAGEIQSTLSHRGRVALARHRLAQVVTSLAAA